MIPDKIKNTFLQLVINFSGEIKEIVSGNFLIDNLKVDDSIYQSCPFLEVVLDSLPKNKSFEMSGMLIAIKEDEFNVNVTLTRREKEILVLIENQTEIYKNIIELNQNRNDNFLIRKKIAKQNLELEKLKLLAEKANEEKSRFLAVMSHEIRNPLNSILGYSELISSKTKNDEINNYAKSLENSGKNLMVIVNDILDLSRFEAGKLKLINESFSLKKTLEICVQDFKLRYKNTEIKLVLNYSNNLPEFIIGDAVRLTQIISNLLNNAFKFTKKGSISVDANLVSKNKEEVCIRFKVTDSGRGMSKSQFKKIFDEYEQTEVSDYRVHAGAGLGLSIVKRLVVAMNGKISVDSELNVGTTFQLEIPFQTSEKQSVDELNTAEISNFNFKNIEALYADDDILNQAIAKHLLTEAGVNITTVADGLEAFKNTEKQNFNVILLDINMPNMTGEEVAKKIRSTKNINSKTPLIAITANTRLEDISRYKKLGFSSVLSKPYKSEDLLFVISKELKK